MRIINALNTRLLFSCVLLLLAFTESEGQGFDWAQGIAVNGNSGLTVCTTDGNNNGYFVGMFSGTADFDAGPGVYNLTAVGDFDMFILKNDAAGNFLWVKHISEIAADTGMCWGKGIGIDNLGNIYVGGYYTDSFDFDPGPGVHALYSHVYGHSFMLKLSPSGDFIWVKDIGNQTNDAGIAIQSIKMDAEANIFFACNYAGNPLANLDVDPGPGVHNIQCQGSTGYDILIEKLDSAGNFIWAKEIIGPSDQSMPALALDSINNIYITGQLSATADFDPGPGIANLTSTASYDAFIAKYDSAGNYLWAELVSGAGEQIGKDITTDTFGNVVLTGYFNGPADFDPGPGVYNLTASSGNMFVSKLRSDGSFSWAKNFELSEGTAIATDEQGNIYTVGESFAQNFVQKQDSAGNLVWLKEFGGGFNNFSADITLDYNNDIYIVGGNSTGDFDPGPDVFNISGGGFIEKLCGTSLALSASDSTLCNGNSVTLTTPAITGATYTWTLNGNVYTGGSNTITVSQAGTYEVYVDGGCPNASAPIFLTYCTGIEETGRAGVAVYPNPFDDELAINGLNTNEQVMLTDITGRVVKEWQATATARSFSTGNLSPGYYVLQVINENGAVRVNVPVVKR